MTEGKRRAQDEQATWVVVWEKDRKVAAYVLYCALHLLGVHHSGRLRSKQRGRQNHVTADDIAEFAGVHRSTVYRLVRRTTMLRKAPGGRLIADVGQVRDRWEQIVRKSEKGYYALCRIDPDLRQRGRSVTKRLLQGYARQRAAARLTRPDAWMPTARVLARTFSISERYVRKLLPEVPEARKAKRWSQMFRAWVVVISFVPTVTAALKTVPRCAPPATQPESRSKPPETSERAPPTPKQLRNQRNVLAEIRWLASKSTLNDSRNPNQRRYHVAGQELPGRWDGASPF